MRMQVSVVSLEQKNGIRIWESGFMSGTRVNLARSMRTAFLLALVGLLGCRGEDAMTDSVIEEEKPPSAVVVLNQKNFEHETQVSEVPLHYCFFHQERVKMRFNRMLYLSEFRFLKATTGATTGDWFVKFYAPWVSFQSFIRHGLCNVAERSPSPLIALRNSSPLLDYFFYLFVFMCMFVCLRSVATARRWRQRGRRLRRFWRKAAASTSPRSTLRRALPSASALASRVSPRCCTSTRAR